MSALKPLIILLLAGLRYLRSRESRTSVYGRAAKTRATLSCPSLGQRLSLHPIDRHVNAQLGKPLIESLKVGCW
jgi:hypothetical protein